MNARQSLVDRRYYTRFQMLEYAVVRQAEKSEPANCVVVDISLGGLQTRSRERFGDGKLVTITIGRGTEPPLDVMAEVRYSAQMDDSDLYMSGFRFRPRSDGEKVTVIEYVHDIFLRQGESLLS